MKASTKCHAHDRASWKGQSAWGQDPCKVPRLPLGPTDGAVLWVWEGGTNLEGVNQGRLELEGCGLASGFLSLLPGSQIGEVLVTWSLHHEPRHAFFLELLLPGNWSQWGGRMNTTCSCHKWSMFKFSYAEFLIRDCSLSLSTPPVPGRLRALN